MESSEELELMWRRNKDGERVRDLTVSEVAGESSRRGRNCRPGVTFEIGLKSLVNLERFLFKASL